MSFSNQFTLIALLCLWLPCANAYEVYFDSLYWRMSESFDWVLLNDRFVPTQNITYKTTNFPYKPGFRIGFGTEGEWDTDLSYTRYQTKMADSANGPVTPTLLASKMAQPSIGYYYQTGQIHFKVNYNVIDANIAKRFNLNDVLTCKPTIGLRGSWIDQAIYTSLQGQISVIENLKNNFKGIGPRVGFETEYTIFQNANSECKLFANFATAFQWGNWSIKDELADSNYNKIMVNNKTRNLASLNFETFLGGNVHYQNWSLIFGYEISDWLNQFQIFDDGTGGHSNDLVLQGLTLGFSYQF